MTRVNLPEGAENKSYYKFINKELTPILKDEEKAIVAMKGDPEKALEFKDRAKLQLPDFIPDAEGTYILKDGTIVVSTAVELENMTGEMLDWFMCWHPLDPVRYAVWNPEDHHGVWISEEDRAHLLDDSLPMCERLWGTTHHVTESMNGEKPQDIEIPFVNLATHGYDMSYYGTDSCMAMIASSEIQQKGPISIPTFMTEIVRKTPDGKVKWLGHWWLGHGYDKEGNEVYNKIPAPLRPVVAKQAAMLIVHNHKEVRHLDKFIPQLYAENKDNWME